MVMSIIGAIFPRFLLLVGWVNSPSFWQSLYGSPIWLLFGFLFFPWTTFMYGFVSPNGMSILNWVFLGLAFMADLGTWGIGALAARKETPSNFRFS